MATFAPSAQSGPTLRSPASPLDSASQQNLTWTSHVRFGEKFPKILCDAAVVLANGMWLLLLFGTKIGAENQYPHTGATWAHIGFRQHLVGLFAYVSITVLACASTELYNRTKAAGFSLFAITKPIVLSAVLFTVFLSSLNVNKLYCLLVVAMAILDLVGLASWRILHRKLTAARITDGHGSRRALIIGAEGTGKQLANYLEANVMLGYTVKGFLDDYSDQPNVLGRVDQFCDVVRSEFIDDVFITNTVDPELIQHLSDEARQCGISLKVVPDICQHATSWECVGNLPVMVIHSEPIPRMGLFLKRILDIVGAASGLMVTLPLLIVIGVLIRLDSPGPCLYRSWRVGKKGKKFMCLKFRTMRTDADKIKDQLRSLNQRVGATFKIKDDPRITRFGKWLRKYSLDELPQLWNVLRGDMSLVGPRPHPLDDYNHYGLEHRLRLRVTPGLTGTWQITARRDPSFERNVALDLEYIQKWSIWMDLKVIAGTLPAVLRGEGQ